MDLQLAAPLELGTVTVTPSGVDGARAIAAERLDVDDYDAAEGDGGLVLTPRRVQARA